MKLYHVTTERMARRYRESGIIIKPVRGFDTPMAAMAWAIKTGRKVIYEIEANAPHKLPDHHNEFGFAWWNDGDVTEFICFYSGGTATGKVE